MKISSNPTSSLPGPQKRRRADSLPLGNSTSVDHGPGAESQESVDGTRLDFVRRVAARYGVSLRPDAERDDTITDHHAAGAVSGATCSIDQRVVWYDEDAANDDLRDVVGAFHELCHVIVQPTGVPLDDLPEEWLLLQFERALALESNDEGFIKAVELSQDGYCTYARISTPLLEVMGEVEEDIEVFEGNDVYEMQDIRTCLNGKDYTTCAFWRSGERLAQEMGLLTEEGRVTWANPDTMWNEVSLGLFMHDALSR